MPDYKSMYLELMDKVEKAKELLIEGQRTAEEIYIRSSEQEDREKPKLVVLEPEK